MRPPFRDLWAVLRAQRRITDDVATQHGLTASQLSALFLMRDGGECPMSALRTHLGITTGGVTSLVDGLAERELVARRADAGDRRISLASLTETGQALTASLAAACEQELSAWVSRLPVDARTELPHVFRALADTAPAGVRPPE